MAKGRRAANGVQGHIEGTEPEKIPGVHEAAIKYEKARDKRMDLTEDEKAAKTQLIAEMNKANITTYTYGDLVVNIDQSQNVKVKREAKANPEDEE